MTTAIPFGSFLALLAIWVPIGAAPMPAVAYVAFPTLDLCALGLVPGIERFAPVARVPFTSADEVTAQGGI